MSNEINTAFEEKFKDDFLMLAQQKESRLEAAVRTDPDMLEGKAGYFDRIGATEAVKVVDRHGDTPLVNTPHSRRRVVLDDYDWADLIDKRDGRRMSKSGQLPERYRENAVWAMNRQKDTLIINAAVGNAYAIDEDDSATTVALPSAQRIDEDFDTADSGLILAKVIEAKRILDAAEVDEEEDRFAVIGSKQVSDLLKITEVTSSEFNTVKALVEGRIDTWMGFKWIRSERLTTTSGGFRECLFFARSGIGLAVGDDVDAIIGERPDKRHSTQVYVSMGMDATRIEDEKVVVCECVES